MAEAEHLATNLDDALPAQPPSQRWRKFLQWIATNPDRRMLSVWLCWCVLSWTVVSLAYAAAVWLVSRLLIVWPINLIGTGYSLVFYSTSLALIAMPILCTPRTAYSVGVPITIFTIWSVATVAAHFTGAWPSPITTVTAKSVSASLATIAGQGVWLGVCFYLVDSFSPLTLSRSDMNAQKSSLSVLRVMIATAMAGMGFAFMRFGHGNTETTLGSSFAMFAILSSPIAAVTWCVVMWAELVQRWKAAIALVSVVLFSAGSSTVAFSALPEDSADPNVSIALPAFWQLALSASMAIVGIGIALRIARLGGYKVRRTTRQEHHGNEKGHHKR